MTKNDGSVSVIIVNWNGRHLLDSCLESVFAQSRPPDEVVVVDNGSRDGSVEYLAERWLPRIRLIRHDSNRGFAGGVNAGIQQSSADWIALLNTDATADRFWLQSWMEVAAGKPDVGMCAAKILLADPPGHIDKVGHLLYRDGSNGGCGFGEPDHGQYDVPGEIFFPDGWAAFDRQRVLEEVGLFDEDFFASGLPPAVGSGACQLGGVVTGRTDAPQTAANRFE